MPSLILHDTTKSQIEKFLASPSHAILLVGPDGIGKTTTAHSLVVRLLELDDDRLNSYPHFLTISPSGNSISIDAIRELQRFLQLKTLGQNTYRRAVLIEHAQALTTEAQNAYLKLLEEPPADTVMVLTADSPRSLLPTILSRLQTIIIHTPSEDQLQPLLSGSAKDGTTKKQAYFLSGGLPGLLSALLDDEQDHPLLSSVATAKEILQKTPFERLAMADSLSKQKDQAKNLIEALERIAQTGLNAAANKQNTAQLKQWHRIRKQSLAALQALNQNANTKLVLTNLFLNL